ncbi:UDP-N-acetylglucosamine 1-carboxyvinyltransferase [Kitasatospora sp. NPDC051984]|uniref:UDP-N-acetylglucosamine 1-carboxyvinyltransferase n=1 Tax=Kitasatospora sp. NPDC051984 TaxID=3364059 RepID=UPI0037CA6350
MNEGISLSRIGMLIKEARLEKNWSQGHLGGLLGTSQSAVARIEAGGQNLTLEMVERLEGALGIKVVSVGAARPMHLRVTGGRSLSGRIDVKSSKNACVALLCASLLTTGRTTLRKVARIEEVYRIVEVLTSIGVRARWINGGSDLELEPPAELDLDAMDLEAARRTRSIIMFLGPLMHRFNRFKLPYAGGCDLGTRTVEPHMAALRRFGLEVAATTGVYHAEVDRSVVPGRPIVLTERGDTVTENALLAAARHDGVTVIRNASPNYMVQDLCFFLERLGVRIDGIGTTTLTVHGLARIDCDVDYSPSEDPVEAMSLLTAAVVTSSELTVCRAPIEFLEIELAVLEGMGLDYDLSAEYPADNGRTRLVDVTVRPSKLEAPIDKIHPMPFPGINIDNVPFFAVIAAMAQGSTQIHDWVYDNRAIYLTGLNSLGATVKLMDPHRVLVDGPTRWRAAEMMCPPALRPAVVVLLAMLAAEGTSVLRNVYVINRGYEDLAMRLNSLGAQIETFYDV